LAEAIAEREMRVDRGRGKEESRLWSKKNSRGRTCFHTTNILSVSIMGLYETEGDIWTCVEKGDLCSIVFNSFAISKKFP
jgi:hypothetical protein